LGTDQELYQLINSHQSFAQAAREPVVASAAADGEDRKSFIYKLSLEIQESVGGSSPATKDDSFKAVPHKKGIFELRSSVAAQKKVIISVRQVSRGGCVLGVVPCIRMSVSPDRNVGHVDMQFLEQVTITAMSNRSNSAEPTRETDVVHVISGLWDPSKTAPAILNNETSTKSSFIYLTVTVDLVLTQVAEPIPFAIETQARICSQTERDWCHAKKNPVKQFCQHQQHPDSGAPFPPIDIKCTGITEEMDQTSKRSPPVMANLTSTGGENWLPPKSGSSASDLPFPATPSCNEDDSGYEEPVLSGFGVVSMDCSTSVLDSWYQALIKWDRDKPLKFPRQLPALVRGGIPHALRGEVWQRLTGATTNQEEIFETYRNLIDEESPDERAIRCDIPRTFLAHEFFKEARGVGQESLYRVSKAYSLYDSEIGYWQGQPFLIAALLVLMPEEQAFAVLVKIMDKLGFRDMFRESLEPLKLRLHQLDCLLEAHLPDLWHHFAKCGMKSDMYAWQWFQTLFTIKFPLFLVFWILDVFLLQGIETIFQVALGILKVAEENLLQLDFEGLMRYLSVNIPNHYRSEENAKHLMAVACALKLKKLEKYEKDYVAMKDAERAAEDRHILKRESENLQNSAKDFSVFSFLGWCH
jgi:hypothetical protein